MEIECTIQYICMHKQRVVLRNTKSYILTQSQQIIETTPPPTPCPPPSPYSHASGCAAFTAPSSALPSLSLSLFLCAPFRCCPGFWRPQHALVVQPARLDGSALARVALERLFALVAHQRTAVPAAPRPGRAHAVDVRLHVRRKLNGPRRHARAEHHL